MNVQGLDLSDDFVRRMRNWARYMSGGAPGALRAMDYGTRIDGGYREADMPAIDGEGWDTEAALATLGLRYQVAVRLFWRYEGRSWVWLGKRMGEGVSNHTAKDRVSRGHELLQAQVYRHLAARRVVAEANRKVAEANRKVAEANRGLRLNIA